MGVTVYDDVGVREMGVQHVRRRRAELIAVGHRDVEAIQLEPCHLLAASPDVEPVGVPEDGRDRGDGLELDQQVVRPDIPGVQDVVHFGEHVEDGRAEQTVCIRDHPQPHLSGPGGWG